jgi:enoyl-CoA hydratase
LSRTYDNLRYEKYDFIARITIDRPAALNSLDRHTLGELDRAFGEAREDASVRVIVLTGSGEKAFASGADIRELSRLDEEGGRRMAEAGQATLDRIEQLGKPVIAAVNGYALGGGCELAMAASIRIASERAVFGQPEVRLGLIPGYGGTRRLPRLVGRGRALEMLLTGENLTAAEALRIGLVDRMVPASELMSEAGALADRIAANAPLAVGRCLEAVGRGLEMSSGEGLALEARLFGLCCGTEDMKEGTRAFLEKRVASFKGR